VIFKPHIKKVGAEFRLCVIGLYFMTRCCVLPAVVSSDVGKKLYFSLRVISWLVVLSFLILSFKSKCFLCKLFYVLACSGSSVTCFLLCF